MKIKFQGNEMNLLGEQVNLNDNFKDFTVTDVNLNPVSLKDTNGVRIFLTAPSIDTPVCDLEVRTFNEAVKNLSNATCYTITMDLPFAQSRWCGNQGIESVKTLSDYKDRSFAESTGTYIKELGLLTRASFVVDSSNKVIFVEYLDEITNEPSYDKILHAAKSAK